MADVRQGRWTAEIDGDFVVFLIGPRINSKLQAFRILSDLGGRRGMNHMLKYLTKHPEKGLLGYETAGFTTIQYWRSFEHLEAFAKNTDDPHLAVWRNYWRRVGKSTRAGIWHETYLVRAGEYEAIYGNMPPHGLGKAATLVPLAESKTCRDPSSVPCCDSETASRLPSGDGTNQSIVVSPDGSMASGSTTMRSVPVSSRSVSATRNGCCRGVCSLSAK